jgi:hypothetical protein
MNADHLNWPECANAFNDKHAAQLSAKRGYSASMVAYLRARQLIGACNGGVAFPTEGGAHWKSRDGSWHYTKGSHVSPFLLQELEPDADVHVFESPWDAIAFADISGSMNVIATRGAGNGRIVARALPENFPGKIICWPQNDQPNPKTGKCAGMEWLHAVAMGANGLRDNIRTAITPAPHKDLNDWILAGATVKDVWNASISATPYAPPTVADAGQVIQFVPDMIDQVAPKDFHQNNASLWRLARLVNSYEDQVGRRAHVESELLPVFDRWCLKSRPLWREGSTREDYWMEFLECWQHAKIGLDKSVSEVAVSRARARALPQIPGITDERIRLLYAMCMEMQRTMAPNPWFLPTKKIGEVFGISYRQAARWMGCLRALRIELAPGEVSRRGGFRSPRYFCPAALSQLSAPAPAPALPPPAPALPPTPPQETT